MDAKWLDRDRIDTEIRTVDFSTLIYDHDFGIYCCHGEPFTGVSCGRHADGKLQSIVHHAEGQITGVSVAWYPNGQIKHYSEMHSDTLHGLHMEWANDGTKSTEQRYRRGELLTA
ncbi:MAG: hypothetical protein EXR98_09720 [Gemmataceae bacterium]|nr:hypothetical protein [Gemmataceae bacterium]